MKYQVYNKKEYLCYIYGLAEKYVIYFRLLV